MNHSKQALILKLANGFGNDGSRQFREHSGKILVGHPNPITAGMEMMLPVPLLPVEVVKLNVNGRRGKPNPSTSVDTDGRAFTVSPPR